MAFRLKAEATHFGLVWLPALAGRLSPAFDFHLTAQRPVCDYHPAFSHRSSQASATRSPSGVTW